MSTAAIANEYGSDVFTLSVMQEYLAKDTVKKLLHTVNDHAPLDPTIANDVAHAMKQWAMARGATHYTHWFQPLTGGTAEKHDAFFEPTGVGETIARFSGKNLIMGEPDASSFPSGGLRCTFEARGYTAWDVTSPAFIKRHSNGATLCIPTVFCSYTGEVLDKKTPLLRSTQAMAKAVRKLMACFGEPADGRAVCTLGPEQEYFLIDRKYYLQRPDLIQCGRTLFGAPPARHQQLEDHYFGSIRPRIIAFMEEVEQELWRLGIPAKTRHNEVAPAQFELAPMFEELNLAIDHNMLTMEVLRNVAEKHGLVCLLHEKPFAGVNGSGKHNNWSVAYNGKNLLDPGSDPQSNAIFLTVLAAVIRAIDEHADILRSATAGAGNDHRLGANEAPPSIISVFLGDQLTEVIERIGLEDGSRPAGAPSPLRIGVDTLPPMTRDTTDRNRTSPFAFTGNKFEFRAPGSSHNCAGVCLTLNTIVAESMSALADEIAALPKEREAFNAGLQQIIRRTIDAHSRVIFNGDGYSEAWVQEAAARGLPNLRTTPEALAPMLDARNLELFANEHVLMPTEMRSRYDVFMEEYSRKVTIEGKVALEMARSMIEPAATAEYGAVCKAVASAKAAGISAGISSVSEVAETLGTGLDRLHAACATLETALTRTPADVLAAMDALRAVVDKLEEDVDDARWPLPKYRDMLFIY